MVQDTLMKWQSREVRPGLTVDIPADAPPAVFGGADAGNFIAGDELIHVGIFWGPGEDLSLWRANMAKVQGRTFGAETSGTVCGRPARRMEVTVPGHSAHFSGGTSGEGYSVTPTKVLVFFAFELGATPVVVYFSAPSDERERYLADELHFLTSIKCSP